MCLLNLVAILNLWPHFNFKSKKRRTDPQVVPEVQADSRHLSGEGEGSRGWVRCEESGWSFTSTQVQLDLAVCVATTSSTFQVHNYISAMESIWLQSKRVLSHDGSGSHRVQISGVLPNATISAAD